MESKVNYAVVGGFVLVLGTAFVAGILWLASGGAFQKKVDFYLAIVNESVAGLNLNAPVKYNGVDVGQVRDIRLDPDNPEQVRLTFAIERGTPIKVDTEAVLKTQGLTGIAYVELSGGGRDSPPLLATTPGEYPEIRTKPSLSARLENVLTTVLAKLDGTSASINALLSEENRAAFKSALADISAVAGTLAARKETLDAGIASAARTFENGARVTAQLAPVIDRMGPVIDRMGRSAEAIEKMANEAERTSAGAGKTVDAVGADVKRFTAETLPELERLLGEMSVLAASLRRLSAKIEGSPGGLLLGRRQVPPGPGE
jgi:phospholipid/cholesterol/gamma-HCH transport system substrate-binding protein